MTLVVLRSFRRRMRLAASAVTAALCVMLFVTCVSAAQMTPAQKACCAAMRHDCGEMARDASCCTGETQADRSLVAAKPTSVALPIALLMAVLDMPRAPVASTRRVARAEPSALKPPGIPTYLFVSSFRI